MVIYNLGYQIEFDSPNAISVVGLLKAQVAFSRVYFFNEKSLVV